MFGIALLIIGLGGAVGLCLSSPAALKQIVVERVPVVCPVNGTQIKVPGRPFVLVMIAVPTISLAGAWWVLGSAFDNRRQPHGEVLSHE